MTIIEFLVPPGPNVPYSDYCGKFCIEFIKNVHSRHSYDAFIDQLDFINLYKNNAIVENIYLEI